MQCPFSQVFAISTLTKSCLFDDDTLLCIEILCGFFHCKADGVILKSPYCEIALMVVLNLIIWIFGLDRGGHFTLLLF